MPNMKLGEICFLPKVKVGGEFTVDVEEMRPITLLPELGKLVNRILAKRICRILQDHPDLLHGAQRGFVKDGNVSQCINTVLDVFEDRQEHKRKSKLFVVSYDLRKAFDSVQEYSLRAALKKMGMPAGFVKYACSMMSEAKSRVRVRHGLTHGSTSGHRCAWVTHCLPCCLFFLLTSCTVGWKGTLYLEDQWMVIVAITTTL